MAKSDINYNILIVGGVVLGGLYLINRIGKNPTATDYTSGLTGNLISDATQSTVKTDLRQTGATERAFGRQETKIVTAQNRQNTRLQRQENRINARLERQSNRLAIWGAITPW